MIARYVQKGEAIDYRPTENVPAGTIVPFAGFVGITRLDIRAGELGALAVSGVFETPKADEAIDVGDPVYWDEANSVLPSTTPRRVPNPSTIFSMPVQRAALQAVPAALPVRPSPTSERSRATPGVPSP